MGVSVQFSGVENIWPEIIVFPIFAFATTEYICVKGYVMYGMLILLFLLSGEITFNFFTVWGLYYWNKIDKMHVKMHVN